MATERAEIIEAEALVDDKPLVLLDIDGVLNAYEHAYADDETPSWDDYQKKYVELPDDMVKLFGYHHGTGYNITWSPTLTNRIRRLAESDDVDVVWLTSWNQFANHLANVCFWPDEKSPIRNFLDTDSHGFNPRYTIQKYMQTRDVLVARARAGVDAPVVNVDDEGIHVRSHAERMLELSSKYPDAYEPDEWRMAMDAPYTAIAPNPMFGITPSQMDAIEKAVGFDTTTS